MKKVHVFCGESIQDNCGKQLHPVVEVRKAVEILKFEIDEIKVYSNSTDFVSAIKYIGEKQKIETEFYLNGVSVGNDIEPIFKDFNRSLDLLDSLAPDRDL